MQQKNKNKSLRRVGKETDTGSSDCYDGRSWALATGLCVKQNKVAFFPQIISFKFRSTDVLFWSSVSHVRVTLLL